MLLFILCPGTIPVPACPASYRPSSSPPAWSGSAVAAPSRRYSRCMTAPTPSSAAAAAPSPSGSGNETRSSPSAAWRPALPRTPRPAAHTAAADRRASAQANPPRPNGWRSNIRWSLILQQWRRRETVPEPFSYPARRFLHAWDRRRHQRLHSSGIRRASGHRRDIRRGIRRGIRNASGHRLRGWTSDLFSSQPRPELRGSPVETGFVLLYWLTAAPWSMLCTVYSPSYKSCLMYRNKLVLS
jgi:hypothetical protein